MDFDEMLRVDRCRDMNELINAEFYYVWKIPRIRIGRPSLQQGMVSKWFYSPRAVGTPLMETRALF